MRHVLLANHGVLTCAALNEMDVLQSFLQKHKLLSIIIKINIAYSYLWISYLGMREFCLFLYKNSVSVFD